MKHERSSPNAFSIVESSSKVQRKYHDIEQIASRPTVARWPDTLKEGTSSKTSKYSVCRYIRSVGVGPDTLISRAKEGGNQGLDAAIESDLKFCNGLEGAQVTMKKALNIKGFYREDNVTLPDRDIGRSKVRVLGKIKKEVVASEYLKMFRKALNAASIRDLPIFC
jgi:hypothetical protein